MASEEPPVTPQNSTPPQRFQRRAERRALHISIAIHLLIAGSLVTWTISQWSGADNSAPHADGGRTDDRASPATAPSPREQSSTSFELPRQESAKLEDRRLTPSDLDILTPADPAATSDAARALLKSKLAEREGLSPGEKRRQLGELAAGRNLPAGKDLDDIAKALGADPNAYLPRDDAPPGSFDFADATLHNITRHKSNGGKTGYRITLVDRPGRTFVMEKYGAEARTYDTAFNVFEMARGNPALRAIIDKTLKPLLAKMVSKPSTPTSKPPMRKP